MGAALPAGMGAARLRRLRTRRLHAERHRLSLGAHDRGGRGLGSAAALRGRPGDQRARVDRSRRAAIARPHDDRLPRELVRLPARLGQRLRRGRRLERAPARAAHPAARPHEGDPRHRRLAGSVRIPGRRAHGALRQRGGSGCAPDPARAPVPPLERPLRHEPDRGGSRGDRHPQRGRRLEQGAARQRGAAIGCAGLRGQQRHHDGRAVRPPQERARDIASRARATPGGRCCSRAGSTGSRFR